MKKINRKIALPNNQIRRLHDKTKRIVKRIKIVKKEVKKVKNKRYIKDI